MSHWATAVGVTLVLGMTAACRSAPPPLRPVADVKQLMHSVLEPAADEYWDGVSTTIDEAGITDFAPETTEEWDALVNHAYVIAESGNLLMLGARPKDGGDWMKYSRALVDTGEKAIRAAESHSPANVFTAGADVYDVCTNCHATYAKDLVPAGQTGR